jgi:hypothetical protein
VQEGEWRDLHGSETCRTVAAMGSVRAAISFLVVTVWTITVVHGGREWAAASSLERCQVGIAGVLVVSAESTPGTKDRVDSDPSSPTTYASISSSDWIAGEFAGIGFGHSRIDARLLQFESLFVRAP